MEARIVTALEHLYTNRRQRIVFWYDSKRELRQEYEDLQISGVEKVEISSNELALKHRLLREDPKSKFLLYHDGPRPSDIENWLLDVLLANVEFHADQTEIWMAELELDRNFRGLVEEHVDFFGAKSRREKLKALLDSQDTHNVIRLKMLAVSADADPRMDSIVENLLEERASDGDERRQRIEKYNLAEFLWEHIARNFGYRTESPGIEDFLLELFKSSLASGLKQDPALSPDAHIFLKRWKNSRSQEEAFRKLSEHAADVLGVKTLISTEDFRSLLEIDFFELVERKIISDLIKAVTSQTVSAGEVSQWIRQRRQSHWYEDYKHLYSAIDSAARFHHLLDRANLNVESFEQGLRSYTENWSEIDKAYRDFLFHVRTAGHASLTEGLETQVDNLYTNNYLLKLGDAWQTQIDQVQSWKSTSIPNQRDFFKHYVKPFLAKDNKVCVIISDALRYEIADDLAGRLRQEDRYLAEIEAVLGSIPSYTQLGMAALLPNEALEIGSDGSVKLDTFSTQGLDARDKVLKNALDGRGVALKADAVLGMNQEELRLRVRENDVIYVYHNRIDSIGDKRDSEAQVFSAAEAAIEELIRLVKKLNNANVYNMLLTADHGFIYQDTPLDESDFKDGDIIADDITFRDRRFLLGSGFREDAGLKHFSADQLGLSGEIEVAIPKSINRLRLRGSGARFVHGGATLQEIVVPVVRINKTRKSDIQQVEVEIFKGSKNVITSGQHSVVLYQAQAASAKVQPRRLRCGIYTASGTLISDVHDIDFDLASENPREREVRIRFVFTRDADDANNQEVVLKLEERHQETSHLKEYKTVSYMMRRSFTSDFDF